jgi:hypothetical protein
MRARIWALSQNTLSCWREFVKFGRDACEKRQDQQRQTNTTIGKTDDWMNCILYVPVSLNTEMNASKNANAESIPNNHKLKKINRTQ